MAESEQKPLLETDGYSSPEQPPPPYKPTEEKIVEPAATLYPSPESLPLPTYLQSEKYEKEGVLDLDNEQESTPINDDDDDIRPNTAVYYDNAGTCCEFTIFFLVTALFSVVGFIFAICVATTAAAQGGAFAGLGVAFITKPIIFETYDQKHVQQYIYENTCKGYHDVEHCRLYVYHTMRFFFWLIGLFGVALLWKGASKFVSTRRPSN